MQFLPEFVILFSALGFFMLSLGKFSSSTLRQLALASAAVAVAAAVVSQGHTGIYFFNAYSIDPFSQVFKLLLCIGLLFVIAMSPGLLGVKERLNAEYYFFLFLSVFGLVLLASAAEFLTLVLCLEISSFSVYVIIPFRRKGKGLRAQMEAALKYMMFGALATGMTLYGISYVYGITHTTYLHELAQIVPGIIGTSPMLVVGFTLILCGIFFKLALFPLHFWAPDVYQGAANETATFVATIPKVGAAVLLLRIAVLFGQDSSLLTLIISVLAVLSMTIGNLSALVQDDVKRLLAYSSIAHAGYLMVGISAGSGEGLMAVSFYITAYLFLNLACFFVIYHLAPMGTNIRFSDIRGLYKRSPILAAVLAAGAVGLAGIPPTVGFMGKLLVFVSAVRQEMYTLVILAVINAAVSAFFYLRLIRAAYTRDTEKEMTLCLSPFSKCLGCVLVAVILGLGLLPGPVTDLFDLAVKNVVPLAGTLH